MSIIDPKDAKSLISLTAKYGKEAVDAAMHGLTRVAKTVAPEIEENANKLGQSLPAVYDKAPALEGELVGDLVTQKVTKTLPDIEGQLADQAPKMITQAETAIPSVAQNAEQAAAGLSDDIPGLPSSKPFSMTDAIDNLSPTQKAVGASGLIGAAAIPLMSGYDGSTPPQSPDKSSVSASEQSKDTNNGYGEKDPNDSIDTPSAKMIDPNSATDYLNMSKNQASNSSPMIPIDQTPKATPDQFDQQLDAAREQDRQHQLMFGLLKAAQMGGSAAGGSKADTSYADTELAKQNNNVTNLKTSMDMKEENQNILDKQQKRDPNSRVSKLYQDTLKQLNPNMDVTGLSAEQVEKAFPQVATAINRQDMIKMRTEDSRQKSLDRQAAIQARQYATINKLDDKDKALGIKYQQSIDEQKQRINTPLGRETARLNGGIHAQSIIDQYRGHENDMPDITKRELAVAMATMTSPGLPHENTIGQMDLKTFSGNVGDIISKVTGTPYGGQAAGYVKFADKLIQNQMNRAKKLIQTEQDRISIPYKNAFHNPESYNLVHDSYSIPKEATAPALPSSPSPTNNGMVDVVNKATGQVRNMKVDIANRLIKAHPDQYGSK